MGEPMKPCCAKEHFDGYLEFIDARLSLGALEDARGHIEKMLRVADGVTARPERFHPDVVAMMPEWRAKLGARLEICGDSTPTLEGS